MIINNSISKYTINYNIQNKPANNKKTTISAPMERFSYRPIFTGMKKNQFEGVDFYVVERFKAPIEKFRRTDYLYEWADEECEKIYNKDISGRTLETTAQRIAMIDEWKNYLEEENKEYSPTEKFIILNGITKNLKQDNDNIPPALNKGILADTIYNFKQDIKINPKMSFDFNKAYMKNLRDFYLSETKDGTGETKWVVIPSKINDPDNFESNVEKLKALSHSSWCTKSNNAEPYLSVGDFHIYLEDGQPKLGVRFIDDTVQEIQGEYNNSKIPLKYYKVFENYQQNNHFKLNDKTKHELVDAAKLKQKVDAIKKDIEPAIKSNNYSKIFEHFGIEVNTDKDGMLVLSHFDEPEGITYDDLGINENNMFKRVSRIKGNAKFCRSTMTDLRSLKEISGDADFAFSKFKTLGGLEKIGGDTKFEWCYGLEDLGQLEEIGGNIKLNMNNIKKFTNLKYIGGNADFKMSGIEDLGSLEEIGGDFKWGYGLKNLGNLKIIGGNADFSHAKIDSLSNLELINGDANFNFAKIESLSKLEEIGEDANFSSAEIGDYGALKSIGGRIRCMRDERENIIQYIKKNNNKTFKYHETEEDKEIEKQSNIDKFTKRIMDKLREQGKI